MTLSEYVAFIEAHPWFCVAFIGFTILVATVIGIIREIWCTANEDEDAELTYDASFCRTDDRTLEP